ncbi:cation:proton antiporter [Candidatus Woesearchaeota archaeon]|nr:cation:proton antiporter [Candidatus Woesearchaeota archaeon]
MISIEAILALLTPSHSIESIFFDIGIIIIIASVFGYILKILKQPLIPAYVLAGVLLGPYGLRIIDDIHVIDNLAEMGIAFLLFVVGMEMDFDRMKSIGLIASVGGTLQIIVLSTIGWLIGIFLGFSMIEAVYCGLMVAFSSTMVVIKLLADKNELDTLHGRIVIGFLLIEDIFAILALLIISNFSKVLHEGIIIILSILLVKIIVIMIFTYVMGKWVFPPLFKMGAESQEILFLLAITTCFLFAFFSAVIGLSVAIGAFLAGLALANLPYNLDIMNKIKALLIFFTTIFFAALGMKLYIPSWSALIIPLICFVAFITFGKPIITSMICSIFGYKRRTSMISAISIAQTSEFSLIIVALGLTPAIGHLSEGSIIPALAILLAIVTMVITSYTIKWDTGIYDRIKGAFGWLNKIGSGNRELDMIKIEDKYDAVLIGHDRIGYSVLKTLQKQHKKSIVIEFNPEIVRHLVNQGVPCIYGDISDIEVLEKINIKEAEIIVSTANDMHDNLSLLHYCKKHGSKGIIFTTALNVDDALKLYSHGSDYVILPHFLGGHHVSVMLEEETMDLNNMLKNKLEHIKELEHRKSLGHHHPTHK